MCASVVLVTSEGSYKNWNNGCVSISHQCNFFCYTLTFRVLSKFFRGNVFFIKDYCPVDKIQITCLSLLCQYVVYHTTVCVYSEAPEESFQYYYVYINTLVFLRREANRKKVEEQNRQRGAYRGKETMIGGESSQTKVLVCNEGLNHVS